MNTAAEKVGVIVFYHAELVMPLETAHKIQALLTEATQVSSYWLGGNIDKVEYYDEYVVPDVRVTTRRVENDARGVDEKIVQAWVAALKEAGDAKGVPLKEFAKTYGEVV